MKLTSIRLLFISLVSALIFSSCQKEASFQDMQDGTTSDKSIVGDYDFAGITAKTLSILTVTDAGSTMKSETRSEYTSFNNAGTVKITDGQIIYNNVTYDISADATLKTYIDGVFIDEITMPINMSLPPFSETSTYVRNSNDSLTINGSPVVSGDPTGGMPSGPAQSGARISWVGDTLLLKVNVTTLSNIDQGGTPVSMSGTVNAMMKFKKKA